jgi:hypothetical protein
MYSDDMHVYELEVLHSRIDSVANRQDAEIHRLRKLVEKLDADVRQLKRRATTTPNAAKV